MTPPDLDPETKARIEAEEAYRAELRARHQQGGQQTPPPAQPVIPPPQVRPPKSRPGCLKIGCGGFLLFILLSALIGMLGGSNDATSTTRPVPPTKSSPTKTTPPATPNPVTEQPASPPASDGRHRMTRTAIACPEKDDYRRFVELISQGDREAAATDAAMKGCTVFNQGEEVFLDDVAVLSGMTKVRRQGEARGYWTAFEAVD